MNYIKDIEELAGKTIVQIRPIYNDFGVYMLEIYLDNEILIIEREHSQDHYLEWRIESK